MPGSDQVVVAGLLVLDPAALHSLRPRVLVDGRPIEATWELRSPAARKRFPDALNAARSRFVSAPIPRRGGWVELVVDTPDGSPLTVATRQVGGAGPAGERRVAAVRARLDRLAPGDDGEPDESTHAALVRKLRRVPQQERDISWLETRVLTDARFRKHPKPTHRRLRQLRDQHRAAGTSPDFAAFCRQLSAVTHPYVLVPHGYKLPLSTRDETDVWREVARLTTLLDDLGHDAFVNSGTLLGLVRDGRLIAHDDDVDLAVILPAETLSGVVADWAVLKSRLAAAGSLRLDFEKTPRTHCKLHAADGLSVDLFPAWTSGGRVFVWPHTFGDVDVSDLLPLTDRVVEGSTVRLPRRPEAFLVRNYGPDWHTEDPAFRFDWAQARRRFATFVGQVHISR